MVANTGGRMGGSAFASKKAAASSVMKKERETPVQASNIHTMQVIPLHPPLFLSGSSIWMPSSYLVMGPGVSAVAEVGILSTILMVQIIAYVLWNRHNRD